MYRTTKTSKNTIKKQLKNVIEERTEDKASSSNAVTEEELLECCICLEENVKESQKTSCGHCVCTECIDRMAKPICPMCRSAISLSDAAYARIEAEKSDRLKRLCYARIFRAINAEYIQYVEMMNDDLYNTQDTEWEDIETVVTY